MGVGWASRAGEMVQPSRNGLAHNQVSRKQVIIKTERDAISSNMLTYKHISDPKWWIS